MNGFPAGSTSTRTTAAAAAWRAPQGTGRGRSGRRGRDGRRGGGGCQSAHTCFNQLDLPLYDSFEECCASS